MSWDSYVNDQLVGTGQVSKAAICGLDGSCWAKSSDWAITPEECKKIADGLSNPGNFSMGGIVAAGTKFIYISHTDEVVRGKKKEGGLHITKTKQAFIIALYEDPIVPGQCANTVEALADYLRNSNY